MTTAKENPLAKSEEGKETADKTPYEIVVMGEAARRFKKNMWEQMVKQANSVSRNILNEQRRAQFEGNMRIGEESYMEKYHGKDDSAKHKNGEWKFRAYLPSSYRTAKSVAANCLETGVKMVASDGSILGKSACEDAYKAGRVEGTTTPKTAFEKCEIALEMIDKLMPQITDAEFLALQAKLSDRARATRVSTAA